jgi:hypothetical protein
MPQTKFSGVAVRPESFNMKAFHDEMQRLRQQQKDVSLKSYLAESFGQEMSPERFYQELGIDLSSMTVEKMLNTSELNKWLFPEIFRDAIRRGLEYTPFYGTLITGEESINGTGLTMPMMEITGEDPDRVRLRDVNEGATITEGEPLITWREKQVTIRKKGRGIKQTYESLMFTPIDLAAIFFEELGTRLGADLDAELINIAYNGDQADGSESAPVIGVETPGTLLYTDLARAWIRFRRLGRNSSVILASEEDALTVLDMEQFKPSRDPRWVSESGVTLRSNVTPLPTAQDIYVHEAVPTGRPMLVDTARAFVQLTAMPLLIESEKIVSRQINGEYVSIITGFANVFRDGRMVLDYTTDLATNPGPQIQSYYSL